MSGPPKLRALVASLAIIAGLALPLRAAESHPPRAEDVQQLLRHKCVKCHNPLHPKGELNLGTLRGMARGGENGGVVTPGKPDDSPLLGRVEADEMPPDRPLPAEEKALLRRWVEAGAPGLPAADPNVPVVGLDHWAFQSLARTAPPMVANAAVVRSPLDAWLQARLEGAGLTLAPEADRRTLVRRVAFDLTGLPPTPDEIAAFLADQSPDAYEQMVDRYLASPRYGEHWGQYWLDAAGYADSSGYFSNERDRPRAWRYRDYVIESFNNDKPLGQFIREQLAGDELYPFQPNQNVSAEQRAALIATHFLSNAPDGTDQSAASPEAMRVDRYAALEGTQEIFASSLLGMTVKCARCHDHKFEPISQREYYQLQSILLPALNPKQWTPPLQRNIRVALSGEAEQWKAKNAELDAQMAALEAERKELDRTLVENRPKGEVLFGADFETGESLTHWRLFGPQGDLSFPAADSPATPALRLKDGTLRVIASSGRAWLATRASFDWTPAETGQWVQWSFRLVSAKLEPNAPLAERVGYYAALRTAQDENPGRGSLLIDGNPHGETLAYFDPPIGPTRKLDPIAQAPFVPGVVYGVRVTNIGNKQYRVEQLIDYVPHTQQLVVAEEKLPVGAIGFYIGNSRSFVIDDVIVERSAAPRAAQAEPNATTSAEAEAKLAESLRRRREVVDALQKIAAQRVAAPGEEIAWNSDASPAAPEVFLLRRGDYASPTEKVEPAGLAVLTDADNTLQVVAPPGGRTTGRRLALAKWLTHPGSRAEALVARVQANRIWLHHFGRGLTRTAENFGLSGEPPQHPELLETLAAAIVDSGGRFKSVHRLILRSTVYRQSSAPVEAALRSDAANRLYWRFPLQRLSAEAIRDGMLAASGELDTTAGGPAVPIEKKGSVQEVARGTLNREIVIGETTPGALRRSVYLQHWRTQIPTALALFGTPSISINCVDRRPATVPLQSLSQLNSEFTRLRAAALARRLVREAGPDRNQQIDRAFTLVAGRSPTAEETSASIAFLDWQTPLYEGPEATNKALADFSQMLLASNLFLYVE